MELSEVGGRLSWFNGFAWYYLRGWLCLKLYKLQEGEGSRRKDGTREREREIGSMIGKRSTGKVDPMRDGATAGCPAPLIVRKNPCRSSRETRQ